MGRICGLILSVLCLASVGCAPRGGNSLRAPESSEERTFQFLSAFYCKEKRWPQSWEEFSVFARARAEGGQVLEGFNRAQFSSQRAILLTLDYQDAKGAARRVSFIAPPQCGAFNDPSVVSMAAGRVLFKLPHGFSVLGGEAVQERWKRPPYPDAAWEDSISTVVIALRFGEVPLPAGGIVALKDKLESSYQSSVTNLSWLVRKVKKQGAVDFLLHEYESDSVKGRLLTASITLPFDGKLLTLNVVGPVDQRQAIEAVAEELYASLRLE